MPHKTSSEPKSIGQMVASRKGGSLHETASLYPVPGPDAICIRNRAVGINHLDIHNLDTNFMSYSRPMILGTEIAGVVEVVGENVTAFKPGDAVMAVCGIGGVQGGYQDVTAVPAHLACHKPLPWSFASAASMPYAYLTACAALTAGLNIPLPHLAPRPHPQTPNTDPSSEYLTAKLLRAPSFGPASAAPAPAPAPPTSVLVLGGSTPVGAAAIQLLRLSLPPSTTIISTNSPAHDARTTAILGATACVDRNLAAAEVVAAVRAATPGGRGAEAVVDAVGALDGKGEGELWGVLSEGGKCARVFPGRGGSREGARGTVVMVEMAVPGGERVMRGLGELMEGGRWKLPVEVEVVGKGLESIAGGVQRLREGGVSGKTFVVSL
ncbi:chaperonin 10-like protein [Podospora conica]|nr:chaperonin 10-like protein [Schizothecium conicum]